VNHRDRGTEVRSARTDVNASHAAALRAVGRPAEPADVRRVQLSVLSVSVVSSKG